MQLWLPRCRCSPQLRKVRGGTATGRGVRGAIQKLGRVQLIRHHNKNLGHTISGGIQIIQIVDVLLGAALRHGGQPWDTVVMATLPNTEGEVDLPEVADAIDALSPALGRGKRPQQHGRECDEAITTSNSISVNAFLCFRILFIRSRSFSVSVVGQRFRLNYPNGHAVNTNVDSKRTCRQHPYPEKRSAMPMPTVFFIKMPMKNRLRLFYDGAMREILRAEPPWAGQNLICSAMRIAKHRPARG